MLKNDRLLADNRSSGGDGKPSSHADSGNDREERRRQQDVLEAVRFTASTLLKTSRWEENLQEVLARLGRATDVSRAFLFENRFQPGEKTLARLRYEWTAPGVPGLIGTPRLQNLCWQTSGLVRWWEALNRGVPVSGELASFREHERRFLEALDIRSLALVPILTEVGLWGGLGFAECVPDRRWSQSELSAFCTAADILAAAVSRQSTEGALLNSEDRFRLVEAHARNVIFQTDLEGHWLFLNPAWQELSGFTVEESLGHHFLNYVHPEDRSQIWRIFRPLVAGEAEECRREIRCQCRDGEYRWVSAHARVTRDREGRILGTSGNLEDITERIQAREALRESERRLQESQKMEALGRLAGGIAHDFNNLLTAINGYACLLRESLPEDDSLRNDVQEILTAGKRASTLTRQLLAFSRRQELLPEILNLKEVVSNLQKMLGRVIGEDVELITEVDPKLGLIKADPGQVEQMLLNLVVNARDAMPRGGILKIATCDVRLNGSEAAALKLQAGGYCRIEIRDTGQGMDQDTLAKAFDPFFTTKVNGTGLGLSMVYGFAQQSGGTITAESTPGEGSIFRVYLPHIPESAHTEEQSPGTTTALNGSETILLVEDEISVRQVAQQILKTNGYRTLTASSAEEAVRLVRDHPESLPLMITDVILPQMSGFDLGNLLRTEQPEMKILFISGYSQVEIPDSLQGRPVAFLEKPFTSTMLLEKIRDLLHPTETGTGDPEKS